MHTRKVRSTPASRRCGAVPSEPCICLPGGNAAPCVECRVGSYSGAVNPGGTILTTRIEIRRRSALAAPAFEQPLHPLLRRVYAARGISCDEELVLSLDRLLPVSSLEGVQAAAGLLASHRERGRVLIVGDFDADGATSSALMVRALRALRFAHVDFMVPDRFRFGYGLTPGIVAAAAEREPTLIVTVDNGVASLAGCAAARTLGIEVLVTDHHLPGRERPAANVIVNPNLPESAFGSRNLAGVGVAFYVVVALTRLMQGGAAISKDLPPFTVARGDNGICGLNAVGLRRAGFSSKQRVELKQLYHALFRSGAAPDIRRVGTLER